MTIEECYKKLGGSYSDIKMRLPSDKLIIKFITKFLNDDSFNNLCAGMQNGKRDEAFRAAHTLKGVCQNLGFDTLILSAGKLTELLRADVPQMPEGAAELFSDVKRDYENTVSVIREYLEENGN
ncbi:MAG: Hpt domain-containing protein [Eubacteriales bacterium]